jgi:hypothetical protein
LTRFRLVAGYKAFSLSPVPALGGSGRHRVDAPAYRWLGLALHGGVISVFVPMQIFQWLDWRRVRPILARLMRVED